MPKETQLPKLERIELALLKEDPNQVRLRFEQDALDELAESLDTLGQQTPLIVRRSGKKFQIMAGHRRLRAAKQAETIEALWCIVVEAKKNDLRVCQIHEIIHHEEHHAVELAIVLWNLREKEDLKNTEVADLVKKSEPWVSGHLRVVEEVAPEIIAEVQASEVPIAMEALILISRVDEHKVQKELWKMVKEGMTIRELRAEIRKRRGLSVAEQPSEPSESNNASNEVRVDFNNKHSNSENLLEVMEILRDDHEVELDEVQAAVEKVFGEDDPDTLLTDAQEEFESEEEAALTDEEVQGHINVAFDALMQAEEKMNQP